MRPSKGVGAANWLVSKTSGFLDARLSRRSFISRATLVGTAVAASGCAVVTQQGSPYTRITDCPGNTLCRDGYTEFCCVINNGINACPSGTVAAGWWRADYSVYCNGTRYYIDCNEVCCGPVRGDGFCAGCSPCRCAAGCNTRKVHCNYFRYGQCNQGVANVGPIACRMVTCTPPYNLDIGCSPSGAVDNATANHNADCGAYAPLQIASVIPALNGTTLPAVGAPTVFARFSNGGIYYRQRTGSTWSDWASLGGVATSGGSAVSLQPGEMTLFTRLADKQLWWQRFDGSSWSGLTPLGGALLADPFALVHDNAIWVFLRLHNYGFYWRRYDGSAWSGWTPLFGIATSSPVAVSYGSDLLFFGRLNDGAVWGSIFTGGRWSAAGSLGGSITSDPAAAVLGSSAFVFGRGSDNALWYRRYDGATWQPWASLGGNLACDAAAATIGNQLFVFARTDGPELSYRATSDGVIWGGWTPMGGPPTITNPSTVIDGSTLHLFAGIAKDHMGYCSYDGTSWSAWEDLDGSLQPMRGT